MHFEIQFPNVSKLYIFFSYIKSCFNEELSWFKQESNICQQLDGGVSSLV